MKLATRPLLLLLLNWVQTKCERLTLIVAVLVSGSNTGHKMCLYFIFGLILTPRPLTGFFFPKNKLGAVIELLEINKYCACIV